MPEIFVSKWLLCIKMVKNCRVPTCVPFLLHRIFYLCHRLLHHRLLPKALHLHLLHLSSANKATKQTLLSHIHTNMHIEKPIVWCIPSSSSSDSSSDSSFFAFLPRPFGVAALAVDLRLPLAGVAPFFWSKQIKSDTNVKHFKPQYSHTQQQQLQLNNRFSYAQKTFHLPFRVSSRLRNRQVIVLGPVRRQSH